MSSRSDARATYAALTPVSFIAVSMMAWLPSTVGAESYTAVHSGSSAETAWPPQQSSTMSPSQRWTRSLRRLTIRESFATAAKELMAGARQMGWVW